MWAWRSFLSRPNPFRSRLRDHVRCHGSQLAAVLGSHSFIGPRRYASYTNGVSQSEVSLQHPESKRHLYVVLDDHKDSYGIHKLDMDDDNDDPDGGGRASSPRRLPVLPALSVALSTLGERAQFAAVGSSIVAIGGKPEKYLPNPGRVLMYDTRTAAMAVSPQVPEGLWYGYTAAMAVGRRLYMLEEMSEMYWRLYSVYPGPGDELSHIGGLHCLAADPDVAGGDELWRWRPLYPSSRWSWSDNGGLLVLPFEAENAFAHAVRAPPGAPHHDIFVSALVLHTGAVTFSFSTASGEWTRLGDWHLPVVGHAHYDGVLDGWLGLNAANEGDWCSPCLTDGHLCAGDIASEPSKWKVGKEKLFRLDDEDAAAGWRHYDAKLVPMAPGEGGNEYCLMERLQPDGDDEDCLGDGYKWLLRLTTFRVERGKDGEPMATSRRQARSYEVSRHNKFFDAQAFWM